MKTEEEIVNSWVSVRQDLVKSAKMCVHYDVPYEEGFADAIRWVLK